MKILATIIMLLTLTKQLYIIYLLALWNENSEGIIHLYLISFSLEVIIFDLEWNDEVPCDIISDFDPPWPRQRKNSFRMITTRYIPEDWVTLSK